MDILISLFDFIMHIDKHLNIIIQSYGLWSYLIFFVIIFCETGLVVLPLLPGDSLLFAAGAFAAIGAFDVKLLLLLIILAAVGGDTVNYWIGYFVGPKVFHKENVRFLNKQHLERTHEFYERYGGKTIILARFVPIIRTFAPFVAGIGKMTYWHFITYNIVGGIAWPFLFILGGYFFGNLPIVRKYFTLVILAIIIISVMPMVIEFIRVRYFAKKEISAN
jgi:membrane-associated protein